MELTYEVRAHQGAKEAESKMVQVTMQTLDGKSTLQLIMTPEEARDRPLWSKWELSFTAFLDGAKPD